ncbi:MAG: hypothetical protein FWG67_03830 [Defluviitaleaceae bacterium]|nr:hypothetical protein [Defluviitaleaceae bacterium]
MSLSVFATTVATDPHFFDKGLPATILTDSVHYFLKVAKSSSAIEKNKTLLAAGLTREETQNYCITSRLFARLKNNDCHQGISDFSSRYATGVSHEIAPSFLFSLLFF